MKLIHDIRRENLERLVSELKTLEALAAAAATTGVYLGQIRRETPDTNGRPRQMGAAMARRLEKACGKPVGWMDIEHSPSAAIDSKNSPAPSPSNLSALINELGSMLRSVPHAKRVALGTLLQLWAADPDQIAYAPLVQSYFTASLEVRSKGISDPASTSVALHLSPIQEAENLEALVNWYNHRNGLQPIVAAAEVETAPAQEPAYAVDTNLKPKRSASAAGGERRSLKTKN